ncbi:hypothetical protein DITRI_Ditri19aG0124500 [Diplodiscus trichospermus]
MRNILWETLTVHFSSKTTSNGKGVNQVNSNHILAKPLYTMKVSEVELIWRYVQGPCALGAKSIPGQHNCRGAWCDRAEIHHFYINGSTLTWSLGSAQAS